MVENNNQLIVGENEGSSSSIIRTSNRISKRDSKFRRLNIGLVGNSKVGKTSLIKRFAIGQEFDNSRSTVATIGLERTPI